MKIICAIFLTAYLSVHFVVTMGDYNGSTSDIVECIISGCSILALGYLFTLI